MGQTFEKPRPEESRGSGEEDALSAHFFPQCAGMGQDELKVFNWQRLHASSINRRGGLLIGLVRYGYLVGAILLAV